MAQVKSRWIVIKDQLTSPVSCLLSGLDLYLISLMIVTIERVNICLEMIKYKKQSQQHLLHQIAAVRE